MTQKILLAEDDIQLIDMYKRKFKLEGFEVYIAENGQEAIDQFETFTPDIVLLDIMMPKVNGLEVLRHIRKDSKNKDALVIILTNLGNEATSEEIYKLGATDYIVKADMTPLEVTNKVKEILKIYKQ
ncbi:MAG: response regulator [Patescibacteria group bacterium]